MRREVKRVGESEDKTVAGAMTVKVKGRQDKVFKSLLNTVSDKQAGKKRREGV